MKGVHPDFQKELTEAVSHILSVVPKEGLLGAMEQFCLPVAQTLHELSSQADEKDNIKQIKSNLYFKLDSLDQLATFFRHVKPHYSANEVHPCMQILEKMWSIIESLFEKHSKHGKISEALCRLFRNAMENYQLCFEPILVRLTPLLVSCYKLTMQPCYIWISAHTVRVFGSDPKYHSILVPLIRDISTSVHMEIQKGSRDEEMVEEYLYFLISAIKAASSLISASELNVTFMCAVHCLKNQPSPMILTSTVEYFTQLIGDAHTGPVFLQNAEIAVTTLIASMTILFSLDGQVVDDVAPFLLLLAPVLGENILTLLQQSIMSLAIPVDKQTSFMNSLSM
jgi:transportin-3